MINYQPVQGELLKSLDIDFPSTWLVFGWILFGSIGTIAVGYAKMKDSLFPAVIGFALMFYPYLFPNGLPFWIVGILLTVVLVMPKRLPG